MVVELVGPYAYRITWEQWLVHSADPAVPDSPEQLPPITWDDMSTTFTVVVSPL